MKKTAFKMHQNNNNFDIFITVMDILELLDVADVKESWIEEYCDNNQQDYSSWNDLVLSAGVQRPRDEKRMSKIEKYIKFENWLFPNAIILCIPKERENMVEAHEINSVYNLDFKIWKSCFILDWQHRIFWAQRYIENLQKEWKNIPKFEFPVVIIKWIDSSKMAEIFTDINSRACKLNPSRIDFTYWFYSKRDPILWSIVNIALFLTRMKDSPLYKRIDMVEKGAWSLDLEDKELKQSNSAAVSLSFFWTKLRNQIQCDNINTRIKNVNKYTWIDKPFSIFMYKHYFETKWTAYSSEYFKEYPKFAVNWDWQEEVVKIVTIWLMKFFLALKELSWFRWWFEGKINDKFWLTKTNAVSVHLYLSLYLIKIFTIYKNPKDINWYRDIFINMSSNEILELMQKYNIDNFYNQKCGWFEVWKNQWSWESKQKSFQDELDDWFNCENLSRMMKDKELTSWLWENAAWLNIEQKVDERFNDIYTNIINNL